MIRVQLLVNGSLPGNTGHQGPLQGDNVVVNVTGYYFVAILSGSSWMIRILVLITFIIQLHCRMLLNT